MIDLAAPVTAATSSAHADPPAATGAGSIPTRIATWVKTTRTASNRPPSRRSQPRTVTPARPNSAAIVAGMTYTEIAADLNVTPKAVERMIANERDRMKKRGIA